MVQSYCAQLYILAEIWYLKAERNITNSIVGFAFYRHYCNPASNTDRYILKWMLVRIVNLKANKQVDQCSIPAHVCPAGMWAGCVCRLLCGRIRRGVDPLWWCRCVDDRGLSSCRLSSCTSCSKLQLTGEGLLRLDDLQNKFIVIKAKVCSCKVS